MSKTRIIKIVALPILFGVLVSVSVGLTIMAQDLSPSAQAPMTASQLPKFKTMATRCPSNATKSAEELNGMFKSQSKEDEGLLEIFNGLCEGTYIEMGALDGVRFSNTHVFNKGFNWKGLLVEPSPKSHALLVKNRPNELTAPVNAAVCSSPRQVHYIEFVHEAKRATNGIWEFTNPTFRTRWWGARTIEHGTPITCRPLNDIIDKHVPKDTSTFFDIFSLDVEGGEFSVLQGLDFSKVGFGIIIVEDQSPNQLKELAIRSLLEQHGYKHLYTAQRNGWYMNKDFHRIYADLV